MPYSSAYWPPLAISSSCVPTSTAARRRARRWVGHPHGAEAVRHQDRDAPVRWHRPSRARGGVALEQRVLGLGVERRGRLVEHQQQRVVAHEAARQRELLPLAEATPRRRPGQVGPSCVSSPPASRATTSSAPARSTAADDRRLVVEARHVADADGLPGAELEAEEVLEGAGQPRRATRRPASAPSGMPSTRIAPDVGSYSLASSFTSVVLPAPFSPTMATTAPAGRSSDHVVEHEPLGAGIGERDVLEADAVGAAGPAPADRRVRDQRRRVVLEPGQPLRAVHPDAAQEADLADRRADVRRQPRAGRQHQQHVAAAAR